MARHEIQHPSLYRAAYTALRASPVRVEWRRESGWWYHATPVKYGVDGVNQVGLLRPESTTMSYRWSGIQPALNGKANPGNPSKYFSRSVNDALLGEITSYAFGTTLDDDVRRMVNADPGEPVRLQPSGFSAALVARRIVVLEAQPGWKFADLSPASPRGAEALGEILHSLYHTSEVMEQLHKAGYQQTDLHAFTAAADHSLASAIGHYVWDSRPNDVLIAGLKVPSMQSDAGLQYGDPDGDNLVCIGAADRPRVHALKPVEVITFTSAPGGSVESTTGPFLLTDP